METGARKTEVSIDPVAPREKKLGVNFLVTRAVAIVKTITGWWFLATPPKNMSSSIGMMIIPNIHGKIKNGNQTTNQISIN